MRSEDGRSLEAGQFGFGKPTGIDIAGESRGILPTLAYRQKAYTKETRPDELAGRQPLAPG